MQVGKLTLLFCRDGFGGFSWVWFKSRRAYNLVVLLTAHQLLELSM
jgi:hypothetical protein